MDSCYTRSKVHQVHQVQRRRLGLASSLSSRTVGDRIMRQKLDRQTDSAVLGSWACYNVDIPDGGCESHNLCTAGRSSKPAYPFDDSSLCVSALWIVLQVLQITAPA
jgi:hypothetical protein